MLGFICRHWVVTKTFSSPLTLPLTSTNLTLLLLAVSEATPTPAIVYGKQALCFMLPNFVPHLISSI